MADPVIDPNATPDPAVASVPDNSGTPTPEPGGTPTPSEPVVAADPAAVADPADPDAAVLAAAAAAPVPDPVKPMDWRERRLSEVAAQKRSLEAKIAELEAKLTPPDGASPPTGADGKPLYTEAQVIARAKELADVKVSEERFTDQCNAVYGQGTAKYEDFQAALANFNQLGGLQRPFVQAALQAGEKAPDLLYALGKDLNEASRIMSLPPVEQAFELARLSLKVGEPVPAKPAAVSGAPAPIKPRVGGGARAEPSVYDDTTSTADWMAIRNKQLSTKNARVH